MNSARSAAVPGSKTAPAAVPQGRRGNPGAASARRPVTATAGWRRSAVTGLAIATGWGPTARAQSAWDTEAGAYLAYQFGGSAPGHLGFGFEIRRKYAQRQFENSCGQGASQTGPYAGVAARLAIFGWDQIHLLIVPQVGLTAVDGSDSGALGGELGVGYRLGHAYGPFVQPGIEASVAGTVFARGSFSFGPDVNQHVISHGGSLDLGVRIAPAVTQSCLVVGRPLRRGMGRAPLPVAYLGADSNQPPAREPFAMYNRQRAARVWAVRASTEWASVPAFWELVDQLAACGAPRALQQKAIAAAEDEIRHALSAAKVAARLAGVPLVLEPPVLVPRDPELGARGLLRLASESWKDGCLGEGAAAACASAEADVADSPAIRAMQRTVAVDEERHAELGWNVLAWALSQADTETVAMIGGFAVPHVPDIPSRPGGEGLDGFGCLSSAPQTSIVIRHGYEASTRFRGLLGA